MRDKIQSDNTAKIFDKQFSCVYILYPCDSVFDVILQYF